MVIYQLLINRVFYYSKKVGLTHGKNKPKKTSNRTIEKGKIFDYKTLIKEDLIDYPGREILNLAMRLKNWVERQFSYLNLGKFIK